MEDKTVAETQTDQDVTAVAEAAAGGADEEARRLCLGRSIDRRLLVYQGLMRALVLQSVAMGLNPKEMGPEIAQEAARIPIRKKVNAKMSKELTELTKRIPGASRVRPNAAKIATKAKRNGS